MDRDQIVELISDNRLQEAIDAIENASRGTHLHNQIILLSSSFAEYSQLNRNATQDFQTLEVQRARIISNLLALLDELSRAKTQKPSAAATPSPNPFAPPPAPKTSAGRKWIWYAAGGLLVVIVLIIALSGGSDDADTFDDTMTTEEPALEEGTINGENVSLVAFGDGTQELGTYSQQQGYWLEESFGDGAQTFKFQEVGRDEWSVYLFDSARQINIRLDLYQQTVNYSDQNNPEERVLYRITGAE